MWYSTTERSSQREEAVGEPLRHVEREVVLGGQLDGEPLPKVAESGRRSTITSNSAPEVQRTSLTSGCGSAW